MNSIITKQNAEKILKENILNFWLKYAPDNENGGFYEQISSKLLPEDPGFKGSTLCLRILWTFSAAYKRYKDIRYLKMANRAYDYLSTFFRDKNHGGIYYSVSNNGSVIKSDKHIDLQAFCIYALTEYYFATGNKEAIKEAKSIFALLEKYAHDDVFMGYYDCFSEKWENLNSESKSLNTQVHIIEAYTSYFTVTGDKTAAKRIAELLELMADKIINPENNHLFLNFDNNWNFENKDYYFGLDIKTSWLIAKAENAIHMVNGGPNGLSVRIASAVLNDGLDENGGLFYKGCNGKIFEKEKSWWPQAEALTGFANAYQISAAPVFLKATENVYSFINENLIDTQNGEWFMCVDENGRVNKEAPKIFSSKCPYHNSRAIMELIERLEFLK